MPAGLCVMFVAFLWWKGFAQPRPAPPEVQRGEKVQVFCSRWTIASVLPLLALAIWLVLPASLLGRDRGYRAVWICAVCSGVMGALSIAVLRSAFVQIELLHGQIRRHSPWKVDETWTAGSLSAVSFWEGRGISAVELGFRSGQKLTLYPFLYNADELVRRVLLTAPDAVLESLVGPVRARISASRKAASEGREGADGAP